MVALSLFDMVLSGDDQTGRSARVAAELIQSALDDLRHIENLDESLAPEDPGNFDRQTVSLVREMYEGWANSTDILLDRLAALERRQNPLPHSDTLRNARGRIRAMLTIPLDRLEQDHHLAEAPGVPIEEVRRELQLGTH